MEDPCVPCSANYGYLATAPTEEIDSDTYDFGYARDACAGLYEFPDVTSMVLSDLSSGVQVNIVAEGSVVVNDISPVMNKEMCLPSDHYYILAIYDSVEDGICCGYGDGWYKVTYDGVMVKEGGDFQSSDYIQIGRGCLPQDDTANTTSDSCTCGDDEASFQIEIKPMHSLIRSLWYSWTFCLVCKIPLLAAEGLIPPGYASMIEIRRCLPANHCHMLIIYDSDGDGICCGYGDGWYNITYDGDTVKEGGDFQRTSDIIQFGGECFPPANDNNRTDDEIVCGENEVSLHIDLLPDRFPEEISMVLTDLSSGLQDTIVAEGSVVVNHTAPVLQLHRCLPVKNSYIFAINDS